MNRIAMLQKPTHGGNDGISAGLRQKKKRQTSAQYFRSHPRVQVDGCRGAVGNAGNCKRCGGFSRETAGGRVAEDCGLCEGFWGVGVRSGSFRLMPPSNKLLKNYKQSNFQKL